MYFEDGSSMFGYHAEDDKGNPINYHCFGVYVDASGRARFLTDARLTRLDMDQDSIPKYWQLRWRNEELTIEADIGVRDRQLLRIWGSPVVPEARPEFDFPLVLDGHARITGNGDEKTVLGRGLAEYYNTKP